MAKTDQPKKQRWYHQIWAAYQMTRSQDPSVTWVILGVMAVALAAGVVLSLLTGSWFWMAAAVPLALLGGMLVLTRRAERAAYTRINGQTGATRAALGTVRGGWVFDEEPVAVSPKTQDMVFRGVGRAGIVLVSEGPSSRVTRMLADEEKRTARIMTNVPITQIQCGDEEGQVSLTKLSRKVQRLRPVLTKAETDTVQKRLRALPGSKLAMPKGVDPLRVRPSRKGPR
jgi:hypothetical protein